MTKKILFVDDDPNILQGFVRQLRKQYAVDSALCGDEGLNAIRERGPFAVVVSDMQMPVMDGVQFLTQVRQLSPDTVRLMLTGNADQHTAVEAVNEGHIFRFLNKPCSAERVAQALDAALEQHRLITAERDLLTKTLSGSVSVLTEVLAMVNPRSFGRSVDVRALVRRICQQINAENAWEIELAALLGQIGCVTVSEATLAKIASGASVPAKEQEAYDHHPVVGSKLVAKIPRLENAAVLIAYQRKGYDGGGLPADELAGDRIPLGARILRLAADFDALRCAGKSDDEAIAIIVSRRNCYDPHLIRVLASIVQTDFIVTPIMLEDLTEDMVLDQHIQAASGEILVSGGRQVAPVMLARLQEFNRNKGVREPIFVRHPLITGDEGKSSNRVAPQPQVSK